MCESRFASLEHRAEVGGREALALTVIERDGAAQGFFIVFLAQEQRRAIQAGDQDRDAALWLGSVGLPEVSLLHRDLHDALGGLLNEANRERETVFGQTPRHF